MIAAILLGILTGLVAAIGTALMGGGLLLALTAYVLTGALALLAGSVGVMLTDTEHDA